MSDSLEIPATKKGERRGVQRADLEGVSGWWPVGASETGCKTEETRKCGLWGPLERCRENSSDVMFATGYAGPRIFRAGPVKNPRPGSYRAAGRGGRVIDFF